MEKIFIDGMSVKAPRTNAPDFVKGSVSFRVVEMIAFLKANDNNGWVNADIKESKGGKWYAELNTWKKDNEPEKDIQDSNEFPY